MILILAIVVAVFSGVVSAEDVSGGLKQNVVDKAPSKDNTISDDEYGVVPTEDVSEGLKQSVDDAEIQTEVDNLSSEELTKALDDDPLHQLPAMSGKISYFCPDCCPTSAWSEPLGVSCGGDDAAKLWFVAMRWPYATYKVKDGKAYDIKTIDSTAKNWWHNKKILVTNPTNGKQVILAVKDWGPGIIARAIDVSKTALDALGAVTDDTVNIEFADQGAELGVVSSSSSYNPQAAVSYSNYWCNSGPNPHGYNPSYHDYSSSGGDCANFVSQCLIAGGLDLSEHPGADSWGCIPYCDNLHDYLVDYLGATWETRSRGQEEPPWFVAGDPAIFGKSYDILAHAVFAVTGDATTSATCNAHTSDQYHRSIQWFFDNDIFDRCTYYHIKTAESIITPLSGDLNGDGTDSYGNFDPSTAGFTFNGKTVNFGTSTDLPVMGDWDHDGKDEIGLYRPDDGGQSKFYLITRDWASLSGPAGAADKTIQFGPYSDNLPIAGDWDGDGDDDIGGFYPGNNNFYLYILDLPSSSAAPYAPHPSVPFGTADDTPMIGDWDGDDDDDIGVFRPGADTNYFYLDLGLTGDTHEMGPYSLGNVGDEPLIGDWNGNGYDNLGVYRPGDNPFHPRPDLPPTPNQPPTLSNGYVTPASGDTATTFNYYVTYTDSDGDAPTTKYVYADGSSHTMTKISGSYTSGAIFKHSTTLSAGSHNYYFYFDDGHSHTVRLPSGTYPGPTVSEPDIRQPISPISFGDVTVGNSLDKTTIIYNDGTGTLTINSITRSSGSSDFTYIGPSTPFDIAAGGSGTITVRFAPSSTGPKNANFNVNSNDPDEANVLFTVSGNGITVPICDGTATSCGIYPNCENCNEDDGCYPYGNGCEERDYYCISNEAGCGHTYSNRHTDGWVDTGNTDWVPDPGNDCQEKEQKEQKYRDYYCSGGACTYGVTDTQWVDTGTTQNKPDGTICGCTARNTLKRCYGGVCTDTGICDSTTCGADAACDGKEPGDSCGSGTTCDHNCKCGVSAIGEDAAVFRNGWWYADTNGDHKTDTYRKYGISGDKPVVGDIDNNGINDMVAYRNGWWYVAKVDHTGTDMTKTFKYCIAGDTPLIGDIDNNGVVDAVAFRNGWWYVAKEDHTGTDWTKTFKYGISGDKPILDDIHNDGSIDTAVLRNGWWYVSKMDHSGTDYGFKYGITGDVPIQNKFV